MKQLGGGPTKAKSDAIDLGLAVLCTRELTPRRMRRSNSQIAAACGCTHQNVQKMVDGALRKLRVRVLFHKDPLLTELVESIIGRAPTL